MIGVDTALNLGWAALCAGALLWHWRRERQQARPQSRRVQLLRVLSVFLAALSLFPCISVSDDYARSRLQETNSAPHSSSSIRNGGGTNLLAIQLEETEHIRPVAPFVLLLVLCCFLMVLVERSSVWRTFPGLTLGRAPPTF